MDSLLKLLPLLFAPAVGMVYGAEEPIVRRASHVVLIRIVSAKPGEWRPAGRQTKTRTVELRVRIEKALKGGRLPSETPITVTQTEPAGPMEVPVPGVWSRRSTNVSEKYVVFSRSASLAEPETLAVRSAREALADTELALRSDARGWTLLESVEHGARQPLGALFTDYAVARLPEILFGSFEQFDGLMALLEKKGGGGSFRGAMVEGIYSRFLLADPAPSLFVGRLVAGSLRMIVGEDRTLRQRLLETLLPNLVGLEGGATKKAASEVLSDYLPDAKRAKSFLRTDPSDAAAHVLAWLQ